MTIDENLHSLEDVFYNALGDSSDKPPPDAWKNIEKELDKDLVLRVKKKYATLKRVMIFMGFLLMAGGALHQYFSNFSRETSSDKKYIRHSYAKAFNPQQLTTNRIHHTSDAASVNSSPVSIINNEKKAGTVFYNSSLQADHDGYRSEENFYSSLSMSGGSTKNQSGLNRKRLVPISELPVAGPEGGKIRSASVIPEHLASDVDSTLQEEYISAQSERSLSYTAAVANIIRGNFDLLPVTRGATGLTFHASGSKYINNPHPAINMLTKSRFKSKSSSYAITAFFSPDIPWYRLQGDDARQSGKAAELENEEDHEFSSTFGIFVDHRLGRHWGARSGLTFSNTNITLRPKVLYAEQDDMGTVKYRINTKTGYGYVLPAYSPNPSVGDSLYAFTSSHSLKYVGVPVAVTYKVHAARFKASVLAGTTINILTRARLETTIIQGFHNSMESVEKLQGLKNVYLSGLAGAEFGFDLSRKTALTFSPIVRFALNSISKDAPVRSYPNAIGLAVGLKFGL